jgi:hypothetical protein
MKSAPAGNVLGIGPTERFPAALGTRCPLRLLSSVTALSGTGVASRTGRT